MMEKCPECGSKVVTYAVEKAADAMDGFSRTVCTECDYIVGNYSEECSQCNVVVSEDQVKLEDFWKRQDYHKRFECDSRRSKHDRVSGNII